MSNFNKLVLGLACFALCYILYINYNKQIIEIKQTDFIKGNLVSIKRDKKNSKLFYNSHTIILKNNSNIFRITPEYKECFKYNEFIKEVKPNDNIEIRIDNNEKRLLNNIKSVIAIKANSKNYIELNCINKSIEDNKIKLPLIIIGLAFFIWFIIYIQKRLGIKID